MVRCAKQYSTVCTSTGTYSRRFIRRETFHNFGHSQALASIADIIKRPSFSRRSGPPGFFTPAAFIKSNIIHCTCHPPSLSFAKYYHPSTPASSQQGCRDRANMRISRSSYSLQGRDNAGFQQISEATFCPFLFGTACTAGIPQPKARRDMANEAVMRKSEGYRGVA